MFIYKATNTIDSYLPALDYTEDKELADVILEKEVPVFTPDHISLWKDCIAGAIKVDQYNVMLANAGFSDVQIFGFSPVFDGTLIQDAANRYGALGAHIFAVK